MHHLLLDELHHHVYVLAVSSDQLLFLSQNGANEPVMLPSKLVQGCLRGFCHW